MDQKVAVIVGAGPAGLTVAYELLARTDIRPVVFEQSDSIGGICQTVNYKGNRMDIGGHRFFSKSNRVMDWWLNILPLEKLDDTQTVLKYHNQHQTIKRDQLGADPAKTDQVMLLRSRRSRIYYKQKFFDYPIALSFETLRQLGLKEVIWIGFSYLQSLIFPIRPEKNLEQFFINRFGRRLYQTFFQAYTEKVWGVPCTQISASWGVQRIKGLSIGKTIKHSLVKLIKRSTDIHQQKTETSLIEHFLYPKFGPGQMWERVAELVQQKGGQIINQTKVVGFNLQGNTVTAVLIQGSDGKIQSVAGDLFFSTMPVPELIKALGSTVPQPVAHIAAGLQYRDFITVGLLLRKVKMTNNHNQITNDNWIYIHEPDVNIGRLQIYNNWSPYLVRDSNTVWLGLEYFCTVGDALWGKSDTDFVQFAIEELVRIDIIDQVDVLDSTIMRMPKAYPAYTGTYSQFDKIKQFTNQFKNLFLLGRNGMHRYNNQDHSMLTAMVAVDNIIQGLTTKDNLWEVNSEDDYHETKV